MKYSIVFTPFVEVSVDVHAGSMDEAFEIARDMPVQDRFRFPDADAVEWDDSIVSISGADGSKLEIR